MSAKLFADTVLRRDASGALLLMNRQAGGFASSCREVASIAECEERYECTVGAWTSDEHSDYAPVTRGRTTAAKVTQFAPRASGARAVAVNIDGKVSVSVESWDEDENDRVLALGKRIASLLAKEVG